MSIDLWASGVILFSMLFGYLPFDDKDDDVLFRKIIDCKLEFPKEFACNTPKLYITKKFISRMNKQIFIDLRNILLPRKLNLKKKLIDY